MNRLDTYHFFSRTNQGVVKNAQGLPGNPFFHISINSDIRLASLFDDSYTELGS